MNHYRFLIIGFLAFLCLTLFRPFSASAQSFKERNEALFGELQRVHGLSEGQMDSIRTLFSRSGYVGQGNPAITDHPVTPQG